MSSPRTAALYHRSVLPCPALVLCVQVLETLVRLKKKDPILKQPDVVLFPQPEGSEGDTAADEAAAADGKKSKPMYLRTVLAKQVGQRQQQEVHPCSYRHWSGNSCVGCCSAITLQGRLLQLGTCWLLMGTGVRTGDERGCARWHA